MHIVTRPLTTMNVSLPRWRRCRDWIVAAWFNSELLHLTVLAAIGWAIVATLFVGIYQVARHAR